MKLKMNLRLIAVIAILVCAQMVQSKLIKKQQRLQRPKSRLDVETGNGIRDKREGFVDLDVLPHAMRGFANNIGKGFSSMVHHGNNLGQKMVGLGHSLVKPGPVVMYGNWKPIYPTDPHYSKPHNNYKHVQDSYRPVSDYRPPSHLEPEYHNTLPIQNYEQVHQPEITYGSFKPVHSSYEPLQPFSEPEIESYGSSVSYEPVQTSYQPTPNYEPVGPSYEPEFKPISSYQPVSNYGPVSSYEPVSTYGPVSSYEPVSTYEPVQSVFETESYGTPSAGPISTSVFPTSNPVNPFTSPSTNANLVNPPSISSISSIQGSTDSDIPPPLRTSSPALSPLPNDPIFVESVLYNSIYRNDVENRFPKITHNSLTPNNVRFTDKK